MIYENYSFGDLKALLVGKYLGTAVTAVRLNH